MDCPETSRQRQLGSHTDALTHTSIRPIDQWAATDGWAGPLINRTNGRPIHQWAQPTHQSDGHNNILI